ncbi:efflux RND transporter periplasmic adaptor subunit [Vulgatibacter sp.]|uniref:efflux RND transporter periplasmic adaptor subunit n=1 Tax=Vulgatibacter sp. TaxID=1971226 RepID=UPI003566DEA3
MAETGIAERMGQLRIDRSRKVRPRRRRLVGLLVLLLLAGAVIAWLLGRPPAVSVVEVREARPGEAVTELTASGYVAAKRRSIIAPQIPGRLVEVLVEEGERVEEGQVIARLDSAGADVGVLQARAQANAALGELRNAEAQLRKAIRDRERAETLAASGAAAQATAQDARTSAEAAEAAVNAARAQLGAAREALAAAELEQDYTVVRAPFTGTIVRKIADEGAVLAPAAITTGDFGGIVEMVDLSSLEVEAEVSEEQLGRIEIGQPALVFLDAWPDRLYQGRATSVRPAIDRAKATAVVKVDFVEPPQGALPDMGAKISFLEKPLDPQQLQADARLRVPASAVVERDGEQVVFVIESERVEQVPVEVEARVGEEVSLAQGPEAGTRVVVAPGERLRGGARVQVREAS